MFRSLRILKQPPLSPTPSFFVLFPTHPFPVSRPVEDVSLKQVTFYRVSFKPPPPIFQPHYRAAFATLRGLRCVHQFHSHLSFDILREIAFLWLLLRYDAKHFLVTQLPFHYPLSSDVAVIYD